MGGSGTLAEKLQPIAESCLHRGEELQGFVASTSMKLYGGKPYVIVVTDKRLVFQQTTTTWTPIERPMPLHPEEVAEYEIRGMVERVLRGPLAPLSRAGFVMQIRTTDDRPFQLMGWTGKGGRRHILSRAAAAGVRPDEICGQAWKNRPRQQAKTIRP